MNEQESFNFERIKSAIEYIVENQKSQPSLDDIAKHIHLSPYHFQRMFTEWAGVSPKRFLQYISLERAKALLKQPEISLFNTAHEIGLSSTSRLHDLFINIEGMTPGEYKNGGENLSINYSHVESPFGKLLIASTAKGICYLSFVDDEQLGYTLLAEMFPNANIQKHSDSFQQSAMSIFSLDWTKPEEIKLHIKGTPFQLKVWEALLKIPMGQLTTYGSIAKSIDNPRAYQAVGTAVGHNPVSFLIPCHRVIQSSGTFGEYHWGSMRKIAMIGWESAKIDEAGEF